MSKVSAFALYKQQMANAKSRGIPFEFSFRDWVSWWKTNLGESWKDLRGRRADQYCMARFGDVGPYSVTNVKCISNRENNSETRENGSIAYGERAGHTKLSEQAVLHIFHSKESMQDLAKLYSISLGTIMDIRSQRTWRRVTMGEVRTSLLGRNQWAPGLTSSDERSSPIVMTI